MTTTIGSVLGDYNVLSVSIASVVGFLAGCLLASYLWFRYLFTADDMNAIETYANKVWGD